MSTNDVPGAKAHNRDALAMGAWAEHADGSLILVESVEAGTVIFSVFDVAVDPPVEYRDAMQEKPFKEQFSWDPVKAKTDPDHLKWTWHDKTPFPWTRVMDTFPSGQKPVSALATLTAAQRVAQSLNLQAQRVTQRQEVAETPIEQPTATGVMGRIHGAIKRLLP